MGGKELSIDGRAVQTPSTARIAEPIRDSRHWFTARRSDVDMAPLQLVADAFLCGRRIEVAPFVE